MHPLMMDLLPLVRQGYCCSQLLVQLLVQAQGREVPDLVRALHGLCHGIGQSGGPCGLLTGGACVLALLAGKGAEGEEPHPMLAPLLNDYASWFYERTAAYGGHSCEQVALGLLEASPAPLNAHRLASAAADFAAKEAFLKAAGTGLREPFSLSEIEAVRQENGAPAYRFSGQTAAWVAQHRLRARLSLSHEGGMALAFCTLEEES